MMTDGTDGKCSTEKECKLFSGDGSLTTEDLVQLFDNKYVVAATMKIDRFFSSLLEDNGKLSYDAMKMLENEEYLNFFTACGPNYVRSLHRAQEVTAIFRFEASDAFEAQSFADLLKLYVHGNRGNMISAKRQAGEAPIEVELNRFDMDFDFDFEKIRQSLSIEIFGYGLGLNGSGSKTLVATSLDEFNEVMRFAFLSMTKVNNDSSSNENQSGIVHSIEVVPWADNSEFLKAAEVNFSRILAPIPRGLIESSRQVFKHGRLENLCTSFDLIADDFGKCCHDDDMVDTSGYQNGDGSKATKKKKCEPKQYLSPVVMRDNLETNAEFASWISSVAQEKMKNLSTLGQCVNKLRSLPKRFDYFYLHSSPGIDYDESIDMSYTVKELKAALDPAADLSILTLLSNENDEYFEMFYQPCLSALYGKNDGGIRNIDPKYFMAKPWYNHVECARVSCLEKNMAWDRLGGNGCVEGLLARETDKNPIPFDSDPFCAKEIDKSTGEEKCKYKFTPKANIIMQIDSCRESLPHGEDGRGRPIPLSMGYLIDYFCMPQVAFDRDQADEEKMLEVDNSWDICVSYITCHLF